MHHIQVGNKTIHPSKILCVGRNYFEHITELKNEVPEQMVLFVKQNSSISTQLQSRHGEPLHYEGELCFLYENNSFTAVGFGFDLTKRALQANLKEKGLPWERAKSFDGSAVFSAFIEINEGIDGEIDEGINQLSFELSKNGQIVQEGNVGMMIYKPDAVLSEIHSFMTLNDGDIVMTGTPKGVGVINQNDLFSVKLFTGKKLLIEDSWTAI